MFDAFKALKPGAWALGNWQIVLGIAGAFALSNTLSYCQGREHGREAAEADYIVAEREAAGVADQSEGRAAVERETDNKEISEAQEGRDNAIENATGGAEGPSDASNRLNCERLRQTGADLSRFPACGGRSGRE